MTHIKEIRLMNETMLIYLKKLGISTKKNEIIKKILQDDACFFKINKENAYLILEAVGVSNGKIENVYSKLISSDEYYYLKQCGKIIEDDNEIKIRYKNYDYDSLFNKKRNV